MASLVTPVQGRPYPAESDVPDVAADLHALALSLENVPPSLTGTLAARPVATAVTWGTIYQATDKGLYYLSTGTVWLTLMAAGAWVNLTLGSGLGTLAGSYAPASRLVGDRVELRGPVKNTSGSTKTSPVTICTLAAAYRPASLVWMAADTPLDGGVSVSIATSGVLTYNCTSAGFLPGDWLMLDGLTYSLS